MGRIRWKELSVDVEAAGEVDDEVAVLVASVIQDQCDRTTSVERSDLS